MQIFIFIRILDIKERQEKDNYEMNEIFSLSASFLSLAANILLCRDQQSCYFRVDIMAS
jgi:hypothetical protein